MAEPVVPPTMRRCKRGHLTERTSVRQAKAAGLKRYFTGKPCPRGHVADRMISSRGCVVCAAARTATWEADNPEKKRAKHAEYRAANRKKINAQRAARYAVKPHEKDRAREAAWRADNREKIHADYATRYAANREKIISRVAAWRTANPEKRNALHATRRARKRALPGRFTAADIAFLMKTQAGKCAHPWCRVSLKKARHIDHIIPLARGGSNDRRNIQLLCPPCNLRKQDKHPIDFAQLHGLLL